MIFKYKIPMLNYLKMETKIKRKHRVKYNILIHIKILQENIMQKKPVRNPHHSI